MNVFVAKRGVKGLVEVGWQVKNARPDARRNEVITLDDTTCACVSKDLRCFTERVRSLYQALYKAGVASFVRRYERYMAEDSGDDHPDAAAELFSGQRASRNPVVVVRILRQRVLCFDASRYVAESALIDHPPQEWFLVEREGGDGGTVWVRPNRMRLAPPKTAWSAFFAGELLRSILLLFDMVGLDVVKGLVVKMLNCLVVDSYRGDAAGAQRFVPLYGFIGNAGCGKTDVARIMGRLYWLVGSLRFGHTCIWIGGQLQANFEGQTVAKTVWAMRQAHGGVLFLDEAYSLAQNGSPYGMQALNTLCGLVDPNATETGLVVAGYPKEMQRDFFAKNQGLWSRLTQFDFADYTVAELGMILDRKVQGQQFGMEKEAMARFLARVKDQKSFWPANAGNGRAIDKLIRLMHDSNSACGMARVGRGETRASIAAAVRIYASADVDFALDEFAKLIKLTGEHAEQLGAFARDLAACTSVQEMTFAEERMRAMLAKFLPRHPDASCLVCTSSYVQLGSEHELYCTQCFFRMPRSCRKCGGEYELSLGQCGKCFERLKLPSAAAMTENIDVDIRLDQHYAPLLAEIRDGAAPTRAQTEEFYVLLNRTASLIALRNGVVLPGAAERTEAIEWFLRAQSVLRAGDDNDAQQVERPGMRTVSDAAAVCRVEKDVARVAKLTGGGTMEVQVTLVYVRIGNAAAVEECFLIVSDFRDQLKDTQLGESLKNTRSRWVMAVNDRLTLKGDALHKVRSGVGSLTLISWAAVERFFVIPGHSGSL